MRYFIYTNKAEKAEISKNSIIERLKGRDFELDAKNPNIVITIGGDGCLLRAIHRYMDRLDGIGFVGVSIDSSLGFLCDFDVEQLDEFIDLLIENKPRFESNKLLEVTLDEVKYYFFNEFRLEKTFNVLNGKCYINNRLFEEFKSNGVCISTPFGSTGYNKSIGGPIVHPRLPSLIYTKIGNINNRLVDSLNSFLMLRHYDIITLEGNFKDCTFGGDYFYHYIKEDEVKKITITTSLKGVIFLRYNKGDYYERVKRNF